MCVRKQNNTFASNWRQRRPDEWGHKSVKLLYTPSLGLNKDKAFCESVMKGKKWMVILVVVAIIEHNYLYQGQLITYRQTLFSPQPHPSLPWLMLDPWRAGLERTWSWCVKPLVMITSGERMMNGFNDFSIGLETLMLLTDKSVICLHCMYEVSQQSE